MSDDEPHTPPVSAIVPHPLYEDEPPVAKADEIHEVNEEPQQPGCQASQVNAPEIGHRRCPADGGHRASPAVSGPLLSSFPMLSSLFARAGDIGRKYNG